MTDHLPEWERPWRDGAAEAPRTRPAAGVTGEGAAADSPFARPSGPVVVRRPARPAPAPEAREADADADAAAAAAAASSSRVAVRTRGPALPPVRPAPALAAATRELPVAGPVVTAGGWPGPAGSGGDPEVSGPAPAAGDAPRERRGSGAALLLIGALVGSAVGTGVTYTLVDDGNAPVVAATAPQNVSAPTINVVPGEQVDGLPIVAAVAQAVTPSVVRIDILGADEQPQGLGSGVIYRSDGYVITNNHVVEEATSLVVRLASGDRLAAEVVGTDPLNDLAVLRVDRDGLPAIAIREDTVLVGEQAIAIGSPFGLDASVTAGVISASNREITVPDDGNGALTVFDVLQTDAAINPGNSGGALVDSSGRLLGINTAILTDTGGSQGVGFAIPVTTAVRNADQLIRDGFVTYPFLGVSGRDLTPSLQEQFQLDNDRGALIDSVEPGSGAAAAGLEEGDIVVAVDDTAIDAMGDLVVAVRAAEVGDTLAVVVLRDGERVDLQITLGERPR